jgi:hypothetical protein
VKPRRLCRLEGQSVPRRRIRVVRRLDPEADASNAERDVLHLLAEDDDGLEDIEQLRATLEIARMRFQVGLEILPYVGRYLDSIVDKTLVVDDVIGLFTHWHEDGGEWDEFWLEYTDRIERGVERRHIWRYGVRMELEWAWVDHAGRLREARA